MIAETCETCGETSAGSETICLVCETPLPSRTMSSPSGAASHSGPIRVIVTTPKASTPPRTPSPRTRPDTKPSAPPSRLSIPRTAPTTSTVGGRTASPSRPGASRGGSVTPPGGVPTGHPARWDFRNRIKQWIQAIASAAFGGGLLGVLAASLVGSFFGVDDGNSGRTLMLIGATAGFLLALPFSFWIFIDELGMGWFGQRTLRRQARALRSDAKQGEVVILKVITSWGDRKFAIALRPDGSLTEWPADKPRRDESWRGSWNARYKATGRWVYAVELDITIGEYTATLQPGHLELRGEELKGGRHHGRYKLIGGRGLNALQADIVRLNEQRLGYRASSV